MGRSALAAVIVSMMGVAAASIPTTDDERLPQPSETVWPAPGAASPACVWRVAFRPPSRLYYGCRAPDTLMTSTAWIDLDPGQLAQLAALAAAMASGEEHDPVNLPALTRQQPTLCDRYWLWATDEGPRAPQMTRGRKIAQACDEPPGEPATPGN